MSGRIRTVKPEIIRDRKTASLSHAAFRLYIGMFVMADDYGNLHGDVAQLFGGVFWAHPGFGVDGTAGAMVELVVAGLVERYEVRGQEYAHICGWSKHQRVDKKGKPRVPPPDDGETLASPSRDPREPLAPDLRSPISDLRSPSESSNREPLASKPPTLAHARTRRTNDEAMTTPSPMASQSMSREAIAIREALGRHQALAHERIDLDRLAEAIEGARMNTGQPVPWLVSAINEAAASIGGELAAGTHVPPDVRTRRVVSFCRVAKAPTTVATEDPLLADRTTRTAPPGPAARSPEEQARAADAMRVALASIQAAAPCRAIRKVGAA